MRKVPFHTAAQGKKFDYAIIPHFLTLSLPINKKPLYNE
jgi:hypothetical protein